MPSDPSFSALLIALLETRSPHHAWPDVHTGSAFDVDYAVKERLSSVSSRCTCSASGGAGVISIDNDYKPKVGTWGVFPRPRNISAAYGGGRIVTPEDRRRTPEQQEARAALHVVSGTRLFVKYAQPGICCMKHPCAHCIDMDSLSRSGEVPFCGSSCILRSHVAPGRAISIEVEYCV